MTDPVAIMFAMLAVALALALLGTTRCRCRDPWCSGVRMPNRPAQDRVRLRAPCGRCENCRSGAWRPCVHADGADPDNPPLGPVAAAPGSGVPPKPHICKGHRCVTDGPSLDRTTPPTSPSATVPQRRTHENPPTRDLDADAWPLFTNVRTHIVLERNNHQRLTVAIELPGPQYDALQSDIIKRLQWAGLPPYVELAPDCTVDSYDFGFGPVEIQRNDALGKGFRLIFVGPNESDHDHLDIPI